MERLSDHREDHEAVLAEMEGRCLHCGHPVSDRPRGCKAGHCSNCGHPYPLGDCSD
jgi:hypothetical protein